MTREMQAAAQLQTTAARAAAEELAVALRKKLAAWRKEEATRSPLVAAVLWGYTETWTARLEQFAAELEQRASALRNDEAALLRELAAPPPAPSRAPRKRAR